MTYRTRFPVRFGDVDSAGIVYYPRFLHFCHIGMECYFRDVHGRPYPEMIHPDRDDLGFPTVHIEADFRRPLRYGDEVEVEVEIEKVGRSSVVWLFRVGAVAPDDADRGEPNFEARIVTVATKLSTLEKVAAPEWLREGG